MAIQTYPIRDFAPVTSLTETTHTGVRLTKAANIILRPEKGFKGTMKYDRLLNLQTFSSLKTTLYGGTSVATLKTTAVQISSQGKNWLYFYDWINNKCRGGPFYMGDDGSFSGNLNLVSGGYTLTSLATGLHTTARWYGQRVLECIYLGNGQDDNLIAQLTRSVTALPHPRLRAAGSDVKPATPVVAAIAIASSTQVQASLVINTRASGVNITFTANEQQFPGADGNNINISITYNKYFGGISINRTGVGSSGSPYFFSITTSLGNSSNDVVVAAFNASPLTFGIVTVASDAPSSMEDTGSWGTAALIGGISKSDSVGFSNTIKSIFLRYWDPGNNGFGYEGPSSTKSADIVIPSGTDTARDVQVGVTGDPSAEGGRFPFIRIYMQFGVEDVVWNLVRTVPNTAGLTVYRLGTDIEVGQPLTVDQSRPPKTKYFTYCAQKIWMAGNLSSLANIWISKSAQADELAPEGCASSGFIVIPGSDESGKSQINALLSDEQNVSAHTSGGITMVTPVDFVRYDAKAPAGAFSQNMIANWEKSKSYFLGKDLLFYEFNGARYGRRDTDFKSLDAAAYMRDIVSENSINANPDRAWLMPEVNGQMMWMWLPAEDGTLKGFAYDMLTQGIVGEFDYPKVYQSARLEKNRAEIVASDEDGNLIVIDTVNQDDHGDALPSQSAFTAYATNYTPPASQNGWGSIVYDGAKYVEATDARLRTGMIDLGEAGVKKKFVGLVFSSIPNSRGIVEITFTGESGISITRKYGDIGEYVAGSKHKILLMLSDYAVRIEFRIITAERKSFIIRDMELLFEPQGRK